MRMLKVGFRAIHGLKLPTLQAPEQARDATKEALEIKTTLPDRKEKVKDESP
jgi:hypothetical protein